jgi:uncharacterized FlaG/YvyC family protein
MKNLSRNEPLVIRAKVTDADAMIPEIKKGDKTLRQIIEEIEALLKPYRKNYTIEIDKGIDGPYIIRLKYEIRAE